MAKKRRDDTSLASLIGNRRKIDIEEIEKATQKVHQQKTESKVETKPKKDLKADPPAKEKAIQKKSPVKKVVPPRTKQESEGESQVVRASIATPYELYMQAKRVQRKEGYRSLGAFYLHCVEEYLKKPAKHAPETSFDFSDSIDVSVSPDLDLWMQVKLNQRKLGFRNMAGFYVFCLHLYLEKSK